MPTANLSRMTGQHRMDRSDQQGIAEKSPHQNVNTF
jgi:hypothetical protein